LTSFGSGKWTYLHAAFVRNGWITEDLFLRDFAQANVLPGAGFANLIALCGFRLRGVPMAIAGLALATLPGTVLIVGAMFFLSGSDPHVVGALRGVVVGAVGLLFAAFVRLSRTVRSRSDVAFVTATLLLTIAGVPLVVTILVVGGLGIWRYRAAPVPAG
jgi:chromate transporter